MIHGLQEAGSAGAGASPGRRAAHDRLTDATGRLADLRALPALSPGLLG